LANKDQQLSSQPVKTVEAGSKVTRKRNDKGRGRSARSPLSMRNRGGVRRIESGDGPAVTILPTRHAVCSCSMVT
jgi:hypothetical protein